MIIVHVLLQGMPELELSELKNRIGESRVTAEGLHVEAGKVAEFAQAITDTKAIYFDKEAAKKAGHDQIPAPPTFLRTWYFDRYRAEGVGINFGFDLGLDPRYTVHGEQEYEYERPVYVGDTLTGTTTLVDVIQREGENGGNMTIVIFETEYCDEDGELVVTVRNTRIETDGIITERSQ